LRHTHFFEEPFQSELRSFSIFFRKINDMFFRPAPVASEGVVGNWRALSMAMRHGFNLSCRNTADLVEKEYRNETVQPEDNGGRWRDIDRIDAGRA
jgi:hypothetical protein